jgi:hypothetical protein
VPRIDLVNALEKKSGDRLVCSDWIPAGDEEATPKAPKEPFADGFSTPGKLYIDYNL